MKLTKKVVLGLFFWLLVINSCSKEQQKSSAGYDPTSDPFADLKAATILAKSSGKRILLEVGGEWCPWCHTLENFLTEKKKINKILHQNYILVKVNYSRENKNTKFLSQYPKISGYPHIFVLDSNGAFLHSQDTALLERGKSYDPDKMIDFLLKWAPNKGEGSNDQH